MESVALYSFQATESDELGFSKGDTLKVGWLEWAEMPTCGMGGWGKNQGPRTAPKRSPASGEGQAQLLQLPAVGFRTNHLLPLSLSFLI